MDWVGSSNIGILEIVLPMMSEHALRPFRYRAGRLLLTFFCHQSAARTILSFAKIVPTKHS